MKEIRIYSYDMDGEIGNWDTEEMYFINTEMIDKDDSLFEFADAYINENAQAFCVDSEDIHLDGDEKGITAFSKQTIYGTLDYYHPVLEFRLIETERN